MNYFLLAFVSLCSSLPLVAQAGPSATVAVCNEENAGCTHQFIDGLKYKTLATDKASAMVALTTDGKYDRIDVTVTNTGASSFDVLPEAIHLRVLTPKEKQLAAVTPEKIISSERNKAGWANALSALGAGMATQQVTTQTRTNANAFASGNNGASASGTYSGSSTSTTTVPDYAAQARARENIARRTEAVDTMESNLKSSVLRANTVATGRSVHGDVYFEAAKHGQEYEVELSLNGTVFRIPLTMAKK